MTAVAIRRAGEEDIHEIVELAVDAWREAYLDVLTGEALEAGPNTLTAEIREGWEHMFVAETRAGILGFFSFLPGTSHIRHIYVHRERHRQGIGSLMMAAAFDILREQGHQEATIDVVEGTGVDGFNRAMGWREVERRQGRNGTVVISMRRTL